MPDRLAVGLAAWIIQDGNYGDFSRGDPAAFALEFHAPHGLEGCDPENPPGRTLTHAGGGRYDAVGRVVHLANRWWAIDFGTLAFKAEPPPRHVELGGWARGEVEFGVDPFLYFEQLAHDPDAPALIYDWTIEKIELQTAPLVEVRPRWRERDQARLGWKEIARIDAWNDDGGSAEYLLHCARREGPARRMRDP